MNIRSSIFNTIVNLLIASIILAGSLLILEFYLRHKGFYHTWSENNGQGYAWVHKHQFTCNSLYNIPNSSYVLSTPEFEFENRFNNEGLRDIDHVVTKSPGEFRIIALGDSYTAGRGTAYEDGWVKVLESQLHQERPDLQSTCIVGGADGIDISCSYELFSSRLRKYDPDLVLLAINNSDVSELMQRNYKRRYHNEIVKRPFYKPSKYKIEILYSKSHLVRFICKELAGLDDYLEREEDKMKLEDAYIHIELIVSKFYKMGRTDDFKTVIVSHPFNHEAWEKRYFVWGETECYMEMLDVFRSEGSLVIDILSHYNEEFNITEENHTDYFWEIDYHHNAAGYFEFGRIVAEELMESGLLH